MTPPSGMHGAPSVSRRMLRLPLHLNVVAAAIIVEKKTGLNRFAGVRWNSLEITVRKAVETIVDNSDVASIITIIDVDKYKESRKHSLCTLSQESNSQEEDIGMNSMSENNDGHSFGEEILGSIPHEAKCNNNAIQSRKLIDAYGPTYRDAMNLPISS
ncbi:hypothetical protein BDB00DRAFT_792084 [Zychaea mexicana]|uniref:uncharacterized protein n=1 Tax=Zychaea mexicana TaxID=64656 RepID=UPI0022FEAE80|nr:uncharacterized protein BDB00DRAFT_792084 [Zychaea mexicana]KAI9488178.1 hypothetical protein BDB00DRAFT_792084 [Zychaea mexicana]